MMNMSAPPPSSMPPPPPSGPPAGAQGHGPFSEEEIKQMMIDTGLDYQQVCQAIESNPSAKTPQDLFPRLYSGAGIQPPGGQTVGDGVVQGQPPPQSGAQPAMAPPEAGENEPPQSAPAEMAEGEGGGMSMGIDPKVAQAVHSAMSPRYRRQRK